MTTDYDSSSRCRGRSTGVARAHRARHRPSSGSGPSRSRPPRKPSSSCGARPAGSGARRRCSVRSDLQSHRGYRPAIVGPELAARDRRGRPGRSPDRVTRESSLRAAHRARPVGSPHYDCRVVRARAPRRRSGRSTGTGGGRLVAESGGRPEAPRTAASGAESARFGTDHPADTAFLFASGRSGSLQNVRQPGQQLGVCVVVDDATRRQWARRAPTRRCVRRAGPGQLVTGRSADNVRRNRSRRRSVPDLGGRQPGLHAPPGHRHRPPVPRTRPSAPMAGD